MQVSLKESELVVAVREYLAKQGINLAGKDVNVDFSATRGAEGIKATINIEEADLPELTPNTQPVLHVVKQLAAIATQPVAAEPPFMLAEAEAPAVEVVEEPKGKTSLFS